MNSLECIETKWQKVKNNENMNHVTYMEIFNKEIEQVEAQFSSLVCRNGKEQLQILCQFYIKKIPSISLLFQSINEINS